MGTLSRLREQLEELSGELEDASTIPDAARQPEISRAQSAIVEARDALSSAFLSRRSMILARESIARAQVAVNAALALSRNLRTRSASLKSDAVEIRSAAADARSVAAGLRARLDDRSYRPGSSNAAGSTVEIESGITDEHVHKREIEGALAQALAAAGGRWKVWITVPAGGTWWGLRIKGPGVEWVETLQGVNDQTPEAIVACVEPLVRLVRAEASYAAKVGRRALLARREGKTD
jgi:hypothetical protein